MDLPTTTAWRPVYFPAGFMWQPSTTAVGQKLPFSIIGGGRWTPGNHYLLGDGMNTAGLSCAELYFPIEAHYAAEELVDKTNLTPQDFIYWALQFQTVAEVANALPTINIVAKRWYSESNWRPFHWILADKTGITAILEPQNETLTLQPISIPVLTNTPNYLAHLKRLADLVKATQLNTATLASYTGALPSGNLPTSRFQRAAVHLAQLSTSASPKDQLLALLDDVAIPRTAQRLQRHNLDYTHYEIVMDLTTQTLTFKSMRTLEQHQLKLSDLVKNNSAHVVAYPFT
ncbi:choloylglycine hydrolase [Furfurilactobacillus siliginis]|nr:choloylglycine hydrolase [Furfurilactobacillus siliginis]